MRRLRSRVSLLLAVVFLLSGILSVMAETTLQITVNGVETMPDGSFLKFIEATLTSDDATDLDQVAVDFDVSDAAGNAAAVTAGSVAAAPAVPVGGGANQYRKSYYGSFHMAASEVTAASVQVTASGGPLTGNPITRQTTVNVGPYPVDADLSASLGYQLVGMNGVPFHNGVAFTAGAVPGATRYEFNFKELPFDAGYASNSCHVVNGEAPCLQLPLDQVLHMLDPGTGGVPARCFQVVAYRDNEVLAVSNWHALNTVEGTVSLPEAVTAPSSGCDISMELMELTAQSCSVFLSKGFTIPEGETSASYLLYAPDAPDSDLQNRFGLQAHIDTMGVPALTVYYHPNGEVLQQLDMGLLAFTGGKASAHLVLKQALLTGSTITLSNDVRDTINPAFGLQLNAHVLSDSLETSYGQDVQFIDAIPDSVPVTFRSPMLGDADVVRFSIRFTDKAMHEVTCWWTGGDLSSGSLSWSRADARAYTKADLEAAAGRIPDAQLQTPYPPANGTTISGVVRFPDGIGTAGETVVLDVQAERPDSGDFIEGTQVRAVVGQDTPFRFDLPQPGMDFRLKYRLTDEAAQSGIACMTEGFAASDPNGGWSSVPFREEAGVFTPQMTGIVMQPIKAMLVKGTLTVPSGVTTGAIDVSVNACDTNGTYDRGDDDIWYNGGAHFEPGQTSAQFLVRIPAQQRDGSEYIVQAGIDPELGLAQEALIGTSGTVYNWGDAQKFTFSGIGRDDLFLALQTGMTLSVEVGLPDGMVAPADTFEVDVRADDLHGNGAGNRTDLKGDGTGTVTLCLMPDPVGGYAIRVEPMNRKVSDDAFVVRSLYAAGEAGSHSVFDAPNAPATRVSAAASVAMRLQEGREVSGTILAPETLSEHASLRVEAHFFNGTEQGHEDDDFSECGDVTLAANASSVPFSFVVPRYAGDFTLCVVPNDASPVLGYRWLMADGGYTGDMYTAKRFAPSDAGVVLNGIEINAIKGNRVYATLYRAARTPLPADGLRVCVRISDDNSFYTDRWVDLTGDSVSMMMVVPSGDFRYEYEIETLNGEPVSNDILRRGFWGGEGTTTGDPNRKVALAVTGDRTANLQLQKGHRLSGTIARPDGDTAEAATVRVQLQNGDGWWLEETRVTIAAGSASADYAMLVPADTADNDYRIQYQCENSAYVSTMRYDESKNGNVVLGNDMGTLLHPIQSMALRTVTLQRGSELSGLFRTPAAVPVDADVTLSFWREDGYRQDTWLQIPQGSSSAGFSITVPSGTAQLPAKYSLEARYEGNIPADWIRRTYFVWRDSAANSILTAYENEQKAVPVGEQNVSGFDLQSMTGTAISGKVYASGSHPAMDVGIGFYPSDKTDYPNNFCYWGTGVHLDADATGIEYAIAIPDDLESRYPGYRYRMEYSVDHGLGYAGCGNYQDSVDHTAPGATVPSYAAGSSIDITAGNMNRFDVNLLPGHDISGVVRLPDGFVAPAGGLDVNMSLRSGNGIDQGIRVAIPEGAGETGYLVTIPSGTGYRMEYSIDDTKGMPLVRNALRKADGTTTSMWEAADLLDVTAARDDVDLTLLTGTIVRGTVEIPGTMAGITKAAIQVSMESRNGTDDGSDDRYYGTDVYVGGGTAATAFEVLVPSDAPLNDWRLSASVDPALQLGLVTRTRYIDGESRVVDWCDGVDLDLLSKSERTLKIAAGHKVSGTIHFPSEIVPSQGGLVVRAVDEMGRGTSWWHSFEELAGPVSDMSYSLCLPYADGYPGSYVIGCETYEPGKAEQNPTTYHRADGGTVNGAFAEFVDLSGANRAGIDIQMRPYATVSGTITLPVAAPVGLMLSVSASHEDTGYFQPAAKNFAVTPGAVSVPYSIRVPMDDAAFDYTVFAQANAGFGFCQYAYYRTTSDSAVTPVSAAAISVPAEGRTGIDLFFKIGRTITGKILLPEAAADDMQFTVLAFDETKLVHADTVVKVAKGATEAPYSLSVQAGRYGVQYQTGDGNFTRSGNFNVTGTVLRSANATMVDLITADAGNIDIMPIRTELTTPNVAAKFGAIVRVPVLVRNGYNVAGADLAFNYDNSVAELVDVASGDGFTISSNLSEPGVAKIAMARADGLFGDFTLCTLVFRITGEVGEIAPINAMWPSLQNPQANGMPFVWKTGRLTVSPVTYGNVSMDAQETVNAGDASLLLQHVVGMPVNLDGNQLLAADVNGDGTVNVGDAILILQKAVGLIDYLPVEMR